MMPIKYLRVALSTHRHLVRLQHSSSKATSALKEISSIPKTPAWSLKEIHQHHDAVQSPDAVLTEAKLRELAELSHLHIDEEKLPSLLRDVESIIQCAKTVQAVTLDEDIGDVYTKSTSSPGQSPLREDVVSEGDCAEQVLSNASVRSGYFFKVPRVLQDE